MAYVAPTSVSDGNVLSASWLNVIADDIEYLYGLAAAPIVAMNNIYTTTYQTTHYVAFQYRHQYMHIRYLIENDPAGSVDFYFWSGSGWIKIAEDGSPAAGTRDRVIDLEWVNSGDGFWYADDIGVDTELGPYTGTGAGAPLSTWFTKGQIIEMRIDVDLDNGSAGGERYADSIRIPWIINHAETTALA